MSTKPIIKQDPENPIPPEIIADAITAISKAARQLLSTRLSKKAIICLIHDQSHVPKKTIEIVINNLSELEEDWLKPQAAGKGK